MAQIDIFEGYSGKTPCEPLRAAESWDVYAERKFSPKVKVTNWWYHREGYPKDHEDVRMSSYDRLGSSEEDDSRWTTETRRAMEEGRGNPELDALKNHAKSLSMLGFLTFPVSTKTRKDLLPEEIKKILPALPRDLLTLRYTTTNQAHYKKVHFRPN